MKFLAVYTKPGHPMISKTMTASNVKQAREVVRILGEKWKASQENDLDLSQPHHCRYGEYNWDLGKVDGFTLWRQRTDHSGEDT